MRDTAILDVVMTDPKSGLRSDDRRGRYPLIQLWQEQFHAGKETVEPPPAPSKPETPPVDPVRDLAQALCGGRWRRQKQIAEWYAAALKDRQRCCGLPFRASFPRHAKRGVLRKNACGSLSGHTFDLDFPYFQIKKCAVASFAGGTDFARVLPRPSTITFAYSVQEKACECR